MNITYYHKLINLIKKHNLDFDSCDVFVETGLYIGETISDLYNQNYFDEIKNVYSIEIEGKLVNECMNRFSFLSEDKFNIIHGDSSMELPSIVKKHNNEKIFFWLDAHYSGGSTGKSEKYGECPTMGELDFLKNINKKPIIIIDDIGFFDGKHKDYPNIDSLKEKLKDFNFNFKITLDEKMQALIIE